MLRKAAYDHEGDEKSRVDHSGPVEDGAAQSELASAVGLGNEGLHGPIHAQDWLVRDEFKANGAQADSCEFFLAAEVPREDHVDTQRQL